MMEATWTTPQTIEGRIDAEFYRNEFIEAAEKLQSHVETAALSEMWTDANRIYIGIAGFDDVKDTKQFTPYLRPVDISDDGFINYENLPWCKREWLDDHEKKGCARPGDLIVEVKGNTRKAAVVDSRIPAQCIVSGSSYRMQLSQEYDAHFVQAYLLTELGQKLKRRLTSNTTINYIDPESFRSYRIPTPDPNVQRAIGNKVRKAEHLRTLAREHLAHARSSVSSLYGERLGFSPSNAAYVNAAILRDRLDPDYYSPEYRCIDDLCATFEGEVRPLGKFVSKPFSGAAIPSELFGEVGEPVLQIKDIRESEINTADCVRIPRSEADRFSRYAAKTGTLILGMSGTIGRTALIYRANERFIVNQRVAALPVTDESFAGFLWAYLNSEIGQRQLMRNSVGGVQANISLSDILSTQVLIPDDEKLQVISNSASSHLDCFDKSVSLVFDAMHDVEQLIDDKLDFDSVVQEGNEAGKWLKEHNANEVDRLQ